MRILALDQSSHVTGYAIFEDGKLQDQGLFNFTNNDLGRRLERIRERVEKMVKEYNIDAVVLEDIQLETTVGNNVAVYKILAEVIGVITELLTEMKIPYTVIAPTVWRKKLGILGYRRADCKAKARKYVLENYHLEVSEDVCDAICIGASQYSAKELKADYDWS